MLTSNLHNSTLRGPTEMTLNAAESSDRDKAFQLGPRAVAALFPQTSEALGVLAALVED